jgi:hypothetical protein
MKKILTLMMAAALMIGFTACEKDDDGPGGGNGGNIFQIGNKTYTIGAACCYWGTEDGYVWYDMWFANKQLWNDEGNWPDGDDIFNPNGFVINVYDLCADNGTPGKIKDGTYTLGYDYGDLVHSGNSDYALYDENGDFADDYIEFGQEYVDESNLVIKVKNISGNIYEITATGGVDENGNAINIYYKGEVDMFED